MKQLFSYILKVLLIFVIVIISADVIRAEAATVTFDYKDTVTGKKITYNGHTPRYVINGVTFDMEDQYAILADGNALAPVRVFTEGCEAE